MPVGFFYGAEAYRLDQAVKEAVAAFSAGAEDTEQVMLDADGLSPYALGEMLQFNSLFVARRVVVIKRPYWLSGGTRKIKYLQEVEDLLTGYLADPPPEQLLILTSAEKAPANKIVKLLTGNKAVETREIAPLSPEKLSGWISDYLTAAGKRVRSDVVRRIALSGQDQYYIKNLLDKLALLPEEEIDAALLEPHLDDKTEIKIFKLLDGVFARDLRAAMAALDHLLYQGEAPAYIFFMLFRQVYFYAWCKALQEQGLAVAEIEKITGQKAFTVKNLLNQARRYSWEELDGFLEDMLRLDIEMKSTAKDTLLQLTCLLTAWVPPAPAKKAR
jgi:DNA polymerase-3 subunit delta